MIIVLGIFFGNILSATDIIGYTATFELNGADSIGADSLTGESVVAPSITRDGWEILGWSTHSGSIISEYDVGDTIVLTEDTTFYAITSKTYFATFESNGANSIVFTTGSCKAYNTQTYCEEGLHTITICDPQDLSECITMMDTNLGAITNDITSTGSYGYHYQWGNNYGFSLYDSVEGITTDVTVDTSAYGPGNWYDNDIFRSITSAPYDWSSPGNDNLWGDTSDTLEARQGPCPDGYHVPSVGEWSMLVKYWRDMYMTGLSLNNTNGFYSFSGSIAREQFQTYFKIPFAGYNSVYDGSVLDLATFAGLWSSSIDDDDAYYFTMNEGGVNILSYGRAHGISLRCFKNSPLSFGSLAPNIIRSGWNVIGWSTDSGATTPEIVVGDVLPLSGDVVLYAITQKDVELTFDSKGGTPVDSQTGILYSTMSMVGIEPSDPTRNGSIFSGWYESGSDIEFDFQNTEITSDITLYAHWDCDVENGYESNGDACLLSGASKTIMEQNPNFEYDTITIYRPASLAQVYKDSPPKYEIMDRNLGATSAGIGSGAYGYYYQFGNNYGFSGEQTSNNVLRSVANVDLTQYGLNQLNGPYYNPVFVLGKGEGTTKFTDWATTSNDNIWGSYAIKESERQGPCPVGYHIPTNDEWNDVVDYWIEGSGGGSMTVSTFRNDLKLPLQGEITRSTAELDKVGSQGVFRTTTPENDVLVGKAYAFMVNNSSYSGMFSENRVNGYAIRCFKDDDTDYTIIYNDGVESGSVFADQVYTGKRGDFVHEYMGGTPVWQGEKVFMGWYVEEGGEYLLVNPTFMQITSDTTIYAKWSECGENDGCIVSTEITYEDVPNLEVYFAKDQDNVAHYTLMDRNLGATEVGTGPNSYGGLYQWGNNYPFPNNGVLVNVSTQQVKTSGYGPDNYYESGVFISGSNDWSTTTNNNLWGDTSNTPTARQGPCPQGYHIPSASEWLTIHNSRSGVTYGNPNGCTGKFDCPIKIENDLLLPTVGRITEKGALGYTGAASYWTSTPAAKPKAYGFYYNEGDPSAVTLQPNNQDNRARARSVRCVKDVNTVPIDIKLNGGEKGAISIYSGNLHYLTNPTKSGYEFEGWYKDLARGIKIEDGEYISPTVTTLYAKWSGEVYDIIYTATFEANGATSVGSTGLSCSVSGSGASGQWCAVVAPTITRDGWNILGWSTDSGASIAQYAVGDDIYLYEDMTYYAITSLVPYYVRHYLKDVGTGTYSLQDTETLSGTTNEVFFVSGFVRDDIPCARYIGGSLSGSETGPGETIDYTSISPDGATVIYLYYTRSVFSVELTGDIGIGFLDGAGPFECGEVVEINAYPIEGYHFDMRELLEGEIDDSG